MIIDSYSSGTCEQDAYLVYGNKLFGQDNGLYRHLRKGLPLGNQSSQWFALYYLDGFDRFIKEELGFKYYIRYMDDAILLCRDKEHLKQSLERMRKYISDELRLEFNQKTQIAPLKSGIDFLGFHFYLSDTGKIIKRLRTSAKKRFKNRLKRMKYEYHEGKTGLKDISPVIISYNAHLAYGHNHRLLKNQLERFVLKK